MMEVFERVRLPLLAVTLATALPCPASASPPPAAIPSVEAVLAHPEAENPFDYAIIVKALWERGDRQQAAFWFYVFQARTRPWALADTRGDGAGALRSALNDELGTVVNGWVASDPPVWRTLAERAIGYERRLPLGSERPPSLDATAWRALVARSRGEYEAQMREAFDGIDPRTFAAERRKARLSVGSWQRPGRPLPKAWR